MKWCVCFPAVLDFSECVQSVTEVRGCKNSKYKLGLFLSDNLMVLTFMTIQVCHVCHRRPSGEWVAAWEKQAVWDRFALCVCKGLVFFFSLWA